MNQIVDYTDPYSFAILCISLFIIVFFRYLVFSGVYHYLFFKLFRNKYENRFINRSPINRSQAIGEIQSSALTSIVFAIAGAFLFVLWQNGHTSLYLDWDYYPIWYLPMSLMIVSAIHETYYYWMHRWMHSPGVYQLVHKRHHESIETNSLTAFSFHPIESLLQAAILPVLIVLIPMHFSVVLLFLIFMTVSATVNHAGVEIYPSFFNKNVITKWLIGATHHDIHHKRANYNFGLYFTFWDRWMGTEHSGFDKSFDELTIKK